MATTTTNFGWDIPQSTDLVKDGATAIAALGQDIDTALVDLKGGTTGQVLAKASNTDLDYSWVAQDDSNAIQNAIVDAKGDLIAATAADTPARLAVGTNGQVLSADSTASTGLAWVPNSGPAFFVYRSTNQSTTQNAFTKIQFNAENYDTANCFDSTTNHRFTPNVAGYYQINATVTSQTAAGEGYPTIYKNGSEYYQTGRRQPQGIGVSAGIVIPMNGTTDYLEVFFYGTAAATGIEGVSAQAGTLFSGVWIRSL